MDSSEPAVGVTQAIYMSNEPTTTPRTKRVPRTGLEFKGVSRNENSFRARPEAAHKPKNTLPKDRLNSSFPRGLVDYPAMTNCTPVSKSGPAFDLPHDKKILKSGPYNEAPPENPPPHKYTTNESYAQRKTTDTTELHLTHNSTCPKPTPTSKDATVGINRLRSA